MCLNEVVFIDNNTYPTVKCVYYLQVTQYLTDYRRKLNTKQYDTTLHCGSKLVLYLPGLLPTTWIR